jgi:hypothetical protein
MVVDGSIGQLSSALIESIGGDVCDVAAVRRRHQERVRSVAERIRQDDAAGVYWPAGAIALLERWVAMDSRYAFVKRLPRSAHFGELLAGEYEAIRFGTRSRDVLECGRLLNLFVTTFDAVCDDIPEALPSTLARLASILGSFPECPPQHAQLEPNLGGVVVGIGSSLAERLGGAILRAPEEARVALSTPVRKAYAAQLSELSAGIQNAVDAAESVEAKSIGPFAVALTVSHAIHGDLRGFEAVGPVAHAMGRLFGWIDDLVDWKDDDARGRPTSLSLFLSTPAVDVRAISGAMPRLIEETQERVSCLRSTLHQYGLSELQPALIGVALDWFGEGGD